MTTTDRSHASAPMSCDEVGELAGLYVLDALEPDEREAIAAHLATCPNAHDEIAELGSVVPALALSVEPIDAPPALKARVLDAVASEAARTTAVPARPTVEVKPWPLTDLPDVSPAARRPRSMPAWTSWAPALAGLLIVALVGAWGLSAQSAATQANERAQLLADAISAYSSAGSSTAVLRGSGDKAGSSGFAAFTPDGKGYLVMVDLPQAPAGQTYQAWYIDDAGPHSAGLMAVGADGYAVMVDDQPMTGAQVVALTVEPLGGSALPTTEPFAAGEVRSPA